MVLFNVAHCVAVTVELAATVETFPCWYPPAVEAVPHVAFMLALAVVLTNPL